MSIRAPLSPALESARQIVALSPSVTAAYNALLKATDERIIAGGNPKEAIADMEREITALNRKALL